MTGKEQKKNKLKNNNMAYKMKGFRGFGNSPLHQEEMQAPARQQAPSEKPKGKSPSKVPVRPGKRVVQNVLSNALMPLMGTVTSPVEIVKTIGAHFGLIGKAGRGGNNYRKPKPQMLGKKPQKSQKSQSKSE